MYLSRLDYVIEHINGTANIFPDFLTRSEEDTECSTEGLLKTEASY